MKKATAFLLGAAGVLALVGAGCSNQSGNPTNDDNGGNSTSSTATTTETGGNNSSSTNDFTVTVSPNGSGKVSVSWNKPADFGAGNSFRVLHSAKPNPSSPGTAFWRQVSASTTDLDLSGIAKGKRYFRVCEYDSKLKKCTFYSNETEVNVE